MAYRWTSRTLRSAEPGENYADSPFGTVTYCKGMQFGPFGTLMRRNALAEKAVVSAAADDGVSVVAPLRGSIIVSDGSGGVSQYCVEGPGAGSLRRYGFTSSLILFPDRNHQAFPVETGIANVRPVDTADTSVCAAPGGAMFVSSCTAEQFLAFADISYVDRDGYVVGWAQSLTSDNITLVTVPGADARALAVRTWNGTLAVNLVTFEDSTGRVIIGSSPVFTGSISDPAIFSVMPTPNPSDSDVLRIAYLDDVGEIRIVSVGVSTAGPAGSIGTDATITGMGWLTPRIGDARYCLVTASPTQVVVRSYEADGTPAQTYTMPVNTGRTYDTITGISPSANSSLGYLLLGDSTEGGGVSELLFGQWHEPGATLPAIDNGATTIMGIPVSSPYDGKLIMGIDTGQADGASTSGVYLIDLVLQRVMAVTGQDYYLNCNAPGLVKPPSLTDDGYVLAGHTANINVRVEEVQAAGVEIINRDRPAWFRWPLNSSDSYKTMQAPYSDGQNVIVPGGIIGELRQGFYPLGMTTPPIIDSVEVQASDGELQPGVYSVVIVSEDIDSLGRRVRSAPSLPVRATVTTAGSRLVVKGYTQRRSFSTTAFYRTEADGQVHYLETRNGSWSDVHGDSMVTTIGEVSDLRLITSEVLYTDAGELENYPPPPTSSLAVAARRIWAYDSVTRKLAPSKIIADGEQPAWNPLIQVPLPVNAGDVVALETIDSNVVAFCENGVFLLDATGGPNNLGQGEWGVVRQISGARIQDARSLVRVGDALYFRSRTEGWVHMLDRSLSVTPVGWRSMQSLLRPGHEAHAPEAPIDLATITDKRTAGAFWVDEGGRPGGNTSSAFGQYVCWVTDDGLELIYQPSIGAWSFNDLQIETYYPGQKIVAATSIGADRYYVTSGGVILGESTGSDTPLHPATPEVWLAPLYFDAMGADKGLVRSVRVEGRGMEGMTVEITDALYTELATLSQVAATDEESEQLTINLERQDWHSAQIRMIFPASMPGAVQLHRIGIEAAGSQGGRRQHPSRES